MNSSEEWALIKDYLRRALPAALWAANCALVFSGMCYLFYLPLSAIRYAALLLFVAGLLTLFIGYMRYRARRKALGKVRDGALNEATPLPAPTGGMEKEYDALLRRALHENAQALQKERDNDRARLQAYSLWTHQIKVPISAMRLTLEERPDQRDATLLAELFKIEQYTEMALTYARLNAEVTDYVIAKYDLDGILKQLIRKFAPLFIQKKLRLRYRPVGMAVITDEKWFLFSLEQILSNAIKYTKEGSVTISADPKEETLCVADTGIGIAAEDLPRVFEQGFTGFNGRGDKRATGLGLTLCKQTLDRLGHSISLESQPGKGTRVIIGLRRDVTVHE